MSDFAELGKIDLRNFWPNFAYALLSPEKLSNSVEIGA